MAGKVDSLTAGFENRIGFWLKKSPLETTPGELVELANLLNELADALSRCPSIVSVISELPQLTKFLYRIVTEPNFHIILVTKRVSLCFCRCLHIFMRSTLQETGESVSEQRRQEIRTKSRDWALMVLRLALFPRKKEESNSLVAAPTGGFAPNLYSSYTANSPLVHKQLGRDWIDWIDYNASHITTKYRVASSGCSVRGCPYTVETHWKRMQEIGLFLSSIFHYSSREEEENPSTCIIYHWLLVAASLARNEHTCAFHLQTKGLFWDSNAGVYVRRSIVQSIPSHLWTLNLPRFVMYRLLLENATVRKEYSDWLESLVWKHYFLYHMFLLDTDIFSNDQRSLFLQVLQEPIFVCWMRHIWLEKIEQCLDVWNKRILIAFWNEATRQCLHSPSFSVAICNDLEENATKTNKWLEVLVHQRQDISCSPTIPGQVIHWLKKYFYWENMCYMQRHLVVACFQGMLGCLSEDELGRCILIISKYCCIPLLSSPSLLDRWNAESFHLFQYIWHRYLRLMNTAGDEERRQPQQEEEFASHQTIHFPFNRQPSIIQMHWTFVDVLFHILSHLQTPLWNEHSSPLLSPNNPSTTTDNPIVFVYMEIIEILLEYCSGGITQPMKTISCDPIPRLVAMYRHIGNSTPQTKRRYQLYSSSSFANQLLKVNCSVSL